MRLIGPLSYHHTLFRAEGLTYDVLRAWKKRPGLLIDRRILSEIRPSLWPELADVQAVLPIPQDWRRSFALSGSPALKLARALSSAYKIPLRTDLLQAMPGPRQAEQPFSKRMARAISYRAIPNCKLKCVLLVDDFKTSGQTLRQAAIALQSLGIPEIQSWSLGTRPRAYPADSTKTQAQIHPVENVPAPLRLRS